MQKSIEQSQLRNRLLRCLPAESFAKIQPYLVPVPLLGGMAIDHVNGPVNHMYFVESGLISLVKLLSDGRAVEVGAVGVEGVTDPIAMFGVDTAIVESMVQIPGAGLRIDREILAEAGKADPMLQQLFNHYMRFAIGQLTRTAACNRLHTLEQRCARWLLTGLDSVEGDTFTITHEFLGMMLGAPRSSVTVAVGSFHKAGMLDYSRGSMTVTDRDELERLTCECYAETAQELGELLQGCAAAKARASDSTAAA